MNHKCHIHNGCDDTPIYSGVFDTEDDMITHIDLIPIHILHKGRLQICKPNSGNLNKWDFFIWGVGYNPEFAEEINLAWSSH